ncbi:hypothetical protein CC1G_06709 [Coprinopsis cinerea okayama7|uniref:F-box domain-containing protein n=1 Tax=Coprinopsis cinerea (strain Okayama-7 / 130 / ATCC MYA-4618 / FGSC 9003) TaxID=240176 RepID=A8P839_COPC7|nr:hypothetical protein CC1G_06709 [Coprinopsis cinerea okayama7\|eukprot:XP_001839496.2 hypothetical protein CC1G_06709 [Coprinopsis cinerea okayama7\
MSKSLAHLPVELIGIIASLTANGDYIARNRTLAACRLVCKRFASEFRPFIFEVLRVNTLPFQKNPVSLVQKKHKLLSQYPQFAPLVKKVVIAISVTHPVVEVDAFSSLLDKLDSVSSVFLGPPLPSEYIRYGRLPAPLRQSLLRLCTAPSIRSLAFDCIFELPTTLFTHSPNLTCLTFCGSTVFQMVNVSQSPVVGTQGCSLHLTTKSDIPQDVASLPIFGKIAKLTGTATQHTVGTFQRLIRASCSSGVLTELDLNFLDHGLFGFERLPIDFSGVKQFTHLRLTFSGAAALLNFATILGVINDTVASLSRAGATSLTSVTIALDYTKSEDEFANELKTTAELWKKLNTALSNSKDFPKLSSVKLDFVMDIFLVAFILRSSGQCQLLLFTIGNVDP